jgi:hypothetical protein
MNYTFIGTIVSAKQVARSTGRVFQLQVSTPFFELTNAEEFFAFMPATQILLDVGPKGKPATVRIECEVKSAREATTKDGTFLYATYQGSLDEAVVGKIGALIGEQQEFTMELPPDEQERLEFEQGARAEEV